MKLTFIGAGGARTPLVIQSILNTQDRVPVRQVCLMDTDAERLDLMRLASQARLEKAPASLQFTWTTDAREAIRDADYIVTTFRAGFMESRVVDEQVPLKYGVLGQETTGPGGFAMALRTIPTLLKYVRLIREVAPGAWLLNFTNPAGIATEAVTRVAGYERTVGICDNPSAMVRGVAAHLGVSPERLYPEYYGLNHLGWLKSVYLDGADRLPEILQALRESGATLPHLPFDARLVETLGALPNEYLYFYYSPRESVQNLLRAGQSRAQQILPFNQALYAGLRRIRDEEADPAEVETVYTRYLQQRHDTYMTLETGEKPREAGTQPGGAPGDLGSAAEGYSGVALGLIQALAGGPAATPILNVPNRGALPGMAEDDVVEVTCYVGNGVVRPIALGALPDHALGLMKSVKAYERLTIEAAVEGSYSLALKALALHPLVPSYEVARSILDDYIAQHGDYFPTLR
jgi:6-phospho-beta-glucosidase